MSASWAELLQQPVKTGSGDHLVQFYENEHFLYQAVTRFVSPGLEHGDGVIIIATASHSEAFEKRLIAKGFNIEKAKADGQLVMLDADATLAQFMVKGIPDAEKFMNVIGNCIDHMAEKFSRIRAYGEMVNITWMEGNLHGTIELEELWNSLAKTHSFTLLCGYGMSGFNQQLHGRAFHEVCRTHSHVIPAEDYVQLEDIEAQRRMIAGLQQQAKALQTEIAGRKEIERALQDALHVRDEFLSIASHELKTPLTSLRLQIQILQRATVAAYGPEMADKIKRAVENSDYQSQRLAKLIDQLMDLTSIRLDRLTLEPVQMDLVSVTQDIVNRLTGEAILDQLSEPSAAITVHSDGPIVGRWDQARIEQVITNLITNAVKFGNNKPIEVRLTLNEGRSGARLVVHDCGIGISAEDQARIFKRFERASSANHYSGLGLGLYIVQQIVDAHSGKISVKSEVSAGSDFIVELPLNTRSQRKTFLELVDQELNPSRC